MLSLQNVDVQILNLKIVFQTADNLIGTGGSSRVFKGSLSDGKELAVKVLKPSEDVQKVFISEIEIISALRHKNIVSLSGFCFQNGSLILVYDFLSRGNLEDNLHGISFTFCKIKNFDCSFLRDYYTFVVLTLGDQFDRRTPQQESSWLGRKVQGGTGCCRGAELHPWRRRRSASRPSRRKIVQHSPQ